MEEARTRLVHTVSSARKITGVLGRLVATCKRLPSVGGPLEPKPCLSAESWEENTGLTRRRRTRREVRKPFAMPSRQPSAKPTLSGAGSPPLHPAAELRLSSSRGRPGAASPIAAEEAGPAWPRALCVCARVWLALRTPSSLLVAASPSLGQDLA
ncbi:hypothetical protein VULLAG_LOCUS20391 [Vulpes lagopus]